MNHRYKKCHPAVVTTNRGLPDWGHVFGDAVVRSLADALVTSAKVSVRAYISDDVPIGVPRQDLAVSCEHVDLRISNTCAYARRTLILRI